MGLPETYVPGFHDENSVRKMTYTQLGNTNMNVSKISLGTGGFSYFYGNYDLEDCKKTVYQAIKSGINYIDTGPWYGHGVSEEILGKCLEGIPRKAYYLATKVGRYEKDINLMFDFSAKKTKQSIEDSLKRLKLDYVDVLQVHDIEFAPNLDMIVGETLPALKEIVQSGKAKYIGITGYPISTLFECIEKSNIKIDMILSYTRLTMIDDALKPFIPKLQEKNVGIVNASANGMGLLSSFGPQDWHPAPQEIKDFCTKARELCKDRGIELGRLAIYHSLLQKGPETVLIGMNRPNLVDDNLDVLFNGLNTKEQETYKEIMKLFSELKVRHWENFELQNYWKFIKGEATDGHFFTTK